MWHWLLQLLIFQNLGKSGFCTCHLQESIIQWCMTMVMQTWYQLKAEELLLASTYDLGYEYVYLRNSWPLNFDYLFLGTPCISNHNKVRRPRPKFKVSFYLYFCCFWINVTQINFENIKRQIQRIISDTVRAEIFAVVLFSRISRVKPSRKFPLQFMSIYK